MLQTNNIHILTCDVGRVTQTLAALKASPATVKAKAKFILATDGVDFEAEDLTSGETVAFPDPRATKAGPWELPTWPWAHEATAAGCKDFRSTKRFIRRFALGDFAFEADGDRHARAYIADNRIIAQCCHFTGRSAEGFIAGEDDGELWLEPGVVIESSVTCRIERSAT